MNEAAGGERLYNGIVLPAEWPPGIGRADYEDFRNGQDLKYYAPMAVPYLERPPDAIPIDVGRQLFVDPFLIETRSNLAFRYHLPEHAAENPMIEPDRPWEQGGRREMAAVMSDGVWYDPEDGRFKMWYRAESEARENTTCLAASDDGVHWEKPELDVVAGTNIVMVHDPPRDSSTVWLDLEETDPERRYKMFPSRGVREPDVMGHNTALECRFSRDGIHWSEDVVTSISMRDRSTVFYNPFRKVWVAGVKVRPCVEMPEGSTLAKLPLTRSRAYRESADVTAAWESSQIVPWVGADNLDPCRNAGIDKQVMAGPHLYNLDCVAYESIVLGMFAIFHGNGADEGRHHHMNDVTLGYSRDGFHWYRPDRRAFLGVSEDPADWNWNNVQSAGGCCLVVGDRLHFYASGRGPAGECRTGLATLRRDGFVSLDASAKEGQVITRPVTFDGKHLFVNVDAPEGELRAEVLQEDLMDFSDQDATAIEPFTRENCVPIRADGTRQAVQWKGADDLSTLSGRSVRFRFWLRNGSLYAFWVSPDASGASHGYVAAGGPGLDGPRDA